jgi:hypothetical protein
MPNNSKQSQKKRKRNRNRGSWIEQMSPKTLVALLLLFVLLLFFTPKIIQAIKASGKHPKTKHSQKNTQEKHYKERKINA